MFVDLAPQAMKGQKEELLGGNTPAVNINRTTQATDNTKLIITK